MPVEKARMGSLVKFEALIQFLDLRIMRDLWGPSADAFLASQKQSVTGGASASNRKKRRHQHQELPEEVRLGLEVLKHVPHLLHMTFLTGSGFRFWAAAQPDHLTISSEDLVMKYGAVIDGLWTVVGRVDGRIGEVAEPLKVSPVVDGIISAMGALRELIGRPRDHFGLTPIAIYAPFQGLAEAEREAKSEEVVGASDSPGDQKSTPAEVE